MPNFCLMALHLVYNNIEDTRYAIFEYIKRAFLSGQAGASRMGWSRIAGEKESCFGSA